MKYKKIWLSLGTAITIIPLITAVSCSTSWKRWNNVNLKQRPTYEFSKAKKAPLVQYSVRTDDKWLNDAWNSTTNTLDLKGVNNQYELIKAIGEITKMKAVPPVDEHWNNTAGIKGYVDQITSKDFAITYKNETLKIPWNTQSIKVNIEKAINDYLVLPDEEKNTNKAFNIEAKGIKNKQPVDIVGIIEPGEAFLAISAVAGLLSESPATAMELAKLLNLPKQAFEEFSNLLKLVDKTLNKIYESTIMKNWVKDQDVNFNVKDQGFYYDFKEDHTLESHNDKYNSRFKGMFIIKTLK